MNTIDWHPHVICRACGSSDLRQYLDLGTQAPANALRPASALRDPEFAVPLSVLWCGDCGLSQLGQVVSPEILYQDYPFRAGISAMWRAHCEELADTLEIMGGEGRDFILDIGSNDGALLEACARRGAKVLGIDPSPESTAIPMLAECWSSSLVPGIIQMHGKPDVVMATNVFGHVHDARDFLDGIAKILPPSGKAIIECPHIFPLLEQTLFDTIYHEHLSYWSLRPLEQLAVQVGLRVTEVQLFPDLHGGTMRYTVVPDASVWGVGTSVTGLRILEHAQHLQGIAPYREFAERAWRNILLFKDAIQRERAAGWRIAGYGAAAKGNVLLQAAGITPLLMALIVDDSPAKWGLYTPGMAIPIQSPELLEEADILVLLSWNNAPELKLRARKHGFRGRFLVPSPEPHFEEAA